MITVAPDTFDEFERLMAHIGEGISTLELLARAGSGLAEDCRGNDALFFIARALQDHVNDLHGWHEEILKAQSK